MNDRTFRILLVDDDEDDIALTTHILSRGRFPLEIRSASNGREALELLRGEGSARPDLVLLDLNMPVMGGLEFLGLVRADADFKTLPVVILTTSNAADEIASSYGLGANAYVNKPLGIDRFTQLAQVVEDFRLESVRLRRDGK